ncbi:MAG: hydroxymethylglutaryl-CoA lyase, partial [Phycisphaerales bacterium]
MSDRVHITDVAPRDGLQNERGFVPTPEKIRLVGLLADAGVDAVEVTSFVSPKWIPQLADAEEVFERVLELFASRDTAPAISALVPNEKGLDRATRFHTPDRPLQIGLFTAASETFCARNLNASIDETIERFQTVVPRALDQGMRIRCYISCAVACPFEGAVAPRAVRAVAEKCIALAPDA